MVIVHVGADQAHDGQALQMVGGDMLPARACHLGVQAGVNQGPALVTAQQIDIDMVQRHRHGHTRPQNARRHFHHRAIGLGGCKRVVEHRAGVQARHAEVLRNRLADSSGT